MQCHLILSPEGHRAVLDVPVTLMGMTCKRSGKRGYRKEDKIN